MSRVSPKRLGDGVTRSDPLVSAGALGTVQPTAPSWLSCLAMATPPEQRGSGDWEVGVTCPASPCHPLSSPLAACLLQVVLEEPGGQLRSGAVPGLAVNVLARCDLRRHCTEPGRALCWSSGSLGEPGPALDLRGEKPAQRACVTCRAAVPAGRVTSATRQAARWSLGRAEHWQQFQPKYPVSGKFKRRVKDRPLPVDVHAIFFFKDS